MLCDLADSLLMKTNTICHRNNRIAIHAILIAQVGAVEHISDAIAIEDEIAVVVTSHDALHIMLTQHIRHLVPVIHIAIAQRIMGKDKDRSIARLRHAVQVMLEPGYILWRHVTIRHADNGTGVETDEVHAIMGESKSTITKNTAEIHHARLRPGSLMIARSSIEGDIQFFQLVFDSLDRGTITGLGQVACDYHKLDRGILIDICNRTLQIFHRTWITRADMCIGQQRKRK